MTYTVLVKDWRSEGSEPIEVEVEAQNFTAIGPFEKPHSLVFYNTERQGKAQVNVAQFPLESVIRVNTKE